MPQLTIRCPANRCDSTRKQRIPKYGFISQESLQFQLTFYAQLFFDLFFAANLTVFSEVHEVTNPDQLTSYVGYFWYAAAAPFQS